MKSHSEKAKSPYQKKGKRPYDYSAMYSRNPHLRRPLTSQVGAYAPHVSNPLYRTESPERESDTIRDAA